MARTERERRLDERDLAILQLAACGVDENAIAHELHCSRRIVHRVLKADEREYPSEPLVGGMLQPGGCA